MTKANPMKARRQGSVPRNAIVMPGLRDTSVPTADRDHPWINQQTFYTLPLRLWELLVKELGKGRFNVENLALELRLSKLCEDHSFRVGFRNGQPILFNRLRISPIIFPKPDCDEWRNKSDAEWKACLLELSTRLNHFASMIRGYLGWLLTNPLFLDEHDRLWDSTAKELARMNIPQLIEARRSSDQLPDGWQLQTANADNVAVQFRDFCLRWQLSEFAGPYLPKPLEARIPNLFSTNAAAPQYQLPATIAIEGRGLLREMITDYQRQSVGMHLDEWMQIVGPDNQGRKTIYRYERIFVTR